MKDQTALIAFIHDTARAYVAVENIDEYCIGRVELVCFVAGDKEWKCRI